MSELDDMPHAEFMLWSRYHGRKAQAQQLAAKMAG
jgi:hypothetical protein